MMFNFNISTYLLFNTMDFKRLCSLSSLLLFQLFTNFTCVQSYENISLGSFLEANEISSFWASASGEFAFGFKHIQNGNYLLAIWFNQIQEKTIVWSANRNKLVQRRSKVWLTKQGWLVLFDQEGRKIWSADKGGVDVAYAAMLNTGNFILATSKPTIHWQSFDHPTDTLLPTQTFTAGINLISCYSEANYSTGRFLMTLKPDGNLALYTTAFPLESPNIAYWSTKTSNSDFQVLFNQSGYVYLVEKNGEIINVVSSNGFSTEDFFQRAVLEYDGVFRHYVYPKNGGSTLGKWSVTWSAQTFIPPNICTSFNDGVGCGACGFNSYCTIGNKKRRECLCPQGYRFFDPDDVMKGCKPDFVPQSCDNPSSEADLFELVEMQNTDWPYSDYEHFESVSEDWCRESCLSDCFCVLAIFRGRECWKKKYPLSNGRMDASIGGKALIKIRLNSDLQPPEADEKTDHHSAMLIIGSVIFGSSVLLNFFLLTGAAISVFYFYDRKNKTFQQYPFMPGISLRRFTYNELQKATNGFNEELGKGAFSTVYKGVLASDSKICIAVKKLNSMVSQHDKEFKTELNAIGQTNHRNLAQLLGFCNEGQHRFLVYEFMSNGSLADLLFRDSKPNWYLRIQIALGTARGLAYLHEECSTQIIHCDIKPQNILLDDALTARISDFGIAKLLKADQTQTSTVFRGTRGYVAPEWFKNLPVTFRVDVYSFGILFLELICCRKNFKPDAKDESEMVLADWAYDCYIEGNLHLLVQDDQEAVQKKKGLKKYVMIAIWCIQEDPALRPTMKKIVQMIEGAVEVPIPPDPSSFQ